MYKLKSFDQFSTESHINRSRKVEEEKSIKRTSEADLFKNLLAEFKVTSIKELTEDQRIEFFTKLKGAEVNESIVLLEEGTRGQVGKIDKKGNITSVYIHYDAYPENVLPILRTSFKDGKNVDFLLKKGDSSGLDRDVRSISFYGGKFTPTKGSIANISKYLKDTANNGGAEFVYLWDEANKQWLMADLYGKGYDEVYPAFESANTFINEAISVQYKRDAKKVLTVYKNLFTKKLTDFGAMDKVGTLGCIRYLFEEAMTDANFHREVVISKNIKGRIGSFELKVTGLGNHFLKIGATTTKSILDKYYSDLANAAGWSGIGIVEGTALYLESIKEEASGQALLNAFNMFESVNVTEGDMINEAKSMKVGDVGYDYLDSTIEIVEVGNFKKISKSFKKKTGDEPSDYGYEETQKGDYYLGKILDSDEGNVGDFAIYPVKYDHSTYWGLSEGTVAESHPKCSNKKGHAYKEIDKDGTVECEYCGLRNSLSESVATEATESLVTERDIVRLGKLDDASMVHKILKDEMIKNKISRTRRGDGEVTVYTNDIPNLKKLMDDSGISYELYESVVTEAEVNSDEEFVEYANTVLQKAFGEDFDEAKAKKVIDGILSKADGDYGTAVGMLTSSLGQ